jgi:hypothetical protein
MRDARAAKRVRRVFKSVPCGEVVQGEAEARDGSEEVERVMRTMPVVIVEEKREAVGALSGRGIGVSVSPLAEGSLDEAFGFAVGFWSIEASEAVLKAEAGDLGGESGGAISGAVVGVETFNISPSGFLEPQIDGAFFDRSHHRGDVHHLAQPLRRHRGLQQRDR